MFVEPPCYPRPTKSLTLIKGSLSLSVASTTPTISQLPRPRLSQFFLSALCGRVYLLLLFSKDNAAQQVTRDFGYDDVVE
mmetsp:Transcript_21932/g.50620  ORF Transcript_21932/g.50620 Transcript_21932/m.50620 type:complete len:80 (-) Transcript_21932:65-304(-)